MYSRSAEKNISSLFHSVHKGKSAASLTLQPNGVSSNRKLEFRESQYGGKHSLIIEIDFLSSNLNHKS